MGRHVDRITTQHLERHHVQHPFVSCGQNDRCGGAVTVGTQPIVGGDAPSVAGPQPGKCESRSRGRQVITDTALMLQELHRDDRTDGMASPILRAGATGAIPEPPGEWFGAAQLEFAAANVALHPDSIVAAALAGVTSQLSAASACWVAAT